MTDAPEWFEDELDERRGSRRHRFAVVAVVVVAWVALVVVILGRDGTDADTEVAATSGDRDAAAIPADDGAAHEGAAHDDAAHDDAARGTTHEQPDEHGRTIDLSGTSDPAAPVPALGDETVTRQELDALALVVVRSWLSDGGPDLALPGIDTDRHAYLEHAAVESVEVAGDLAVARTVLILLVRDGDHYTEAVVRRAAVPFVATLTSLRPAGTPWWLPGTSSPVASPPPAVADDDPAALEAVAAALAAAGYLDPQVASVAVTATGTVIAEVTARTPADDALDGHIWLHPTAEGLVVLGGDHHRPATPSGTTPDPGATPDEPEDTTEPPSSAGNAPD